MFWQKKTTWFCCHKDGCFLRALKHIPVYSRPLVSRIQKSKRRLKQWSLTLQPPRALGVTPPPPPSPPPLTLNSAHVHNQNTIWHMM